MECEASLTVPQRVFSNFLVKHSELAHFSLLTDQKAKQALHSLIFSVARNISFYKKSVDSRVLERFTWAHKLCSEESM